MVKTVIVDDQSKSRQNLEKIIEDYCHDVSVVASVDNVQDAIFAIHKHEPELVFLDVMMRNETGFDLLEKINKIDFSVVFTTAHSEFAIKAIKFSALDYLLKPIDIDELKNAIRKVNEKHKSSIFVKQTVENLLSNLRTNNLKDHKIALPVSNGLIFVRLNDILYCQGDNNYTHIYTKDNKKYLVSKTLKEYEDMLNEFNFFRIHKTYLINLNELKEYMRGDGGYVVMNNNAALKVSKRKKDLFLQRIMKTNR